MKYLLNGQESERLQFRLLNKDDYPIWLAFFKHPDVSKYLGMDIFPTAQIKNDKWFELVFNRYDNDLGGMNVLIDKETNEFVGQCGLLVQKIDGKNELEIGYSILPKFWHKGYASEAAKKCRDFAFENNFADSLISIIHIDNIGSQKVAENNGMVARSQSEYKGMPVDIYRIYKSEWLELIQKKQIDL